MLQQALLDGSEPVLALRYTPRSEFYLFDLPHNIFMRVSLRPLDHGADFSFELTGNRGAALTTRHSTYNEDAQFDSAFKEYTKRHYKSWDKFARDKKYGENLQPVLVSGFDMTKDFAMVAYSNNSTSVQAGATISTPMFGSVSMSAWGVWHTKCTPFVKHGPQQLEPRSRIHSAFGAAKRRFAKSNQCVFVRYYTMRLELGMVPRVIRAGAGPHDLGPGENRGDTFPELTSRSDAEPVSDDQDSGGQRNPTADCPSSELDTAVHNAPYVWFSAPSSVPALTFPSRMKNMTVGMPSRTTCSR